MEEVHLHIVLPGNDHSESAYRAPFHDPELDPALIPTGAQYLRSTLASGCHKLAGECQAIRVFDHEIYLQEKTGSEFSIKIPEPVDVEDLNLQAYFDEVRSL